MYGGSGADSPFVAGSVPSWLTVVQCIFAGVVIGLVSVEAGAWRGELRRSGARWTVAWSLALAAVCLFNGLYGVMAGPSADAMLFLRFIALGAAVVLSLPAIRTYVSGPPVRLLAAITAVWYLAGAAAWWTTDLMLTGVGPGGLPSYGVLLVAVELAPVAVVGAYILRAVRGMEITTAGAVVTATGVVSVVALIASSLLPTTALTEMVRGLWVVPVIIGLEFLAAARVRRIRGAADRRAGMRDVLASVSNSAWLVRNPEELLEQARVRCRVLLDDPSIQGTLRPLSRDRFVTEFYSADGRRLLPDEQSFLRDLARVVSSATERHVLNTKLRDAAYTDALTGLHNRPALDHHLSSLLGRAEVENTRVGVLFCDLDSFKHANDLRGREWGDRLLAKTAKHLSETVGDDAYVARHGGDDFVVVIPRAGSDTELLGLARRVHKRFEYLTHRVPATPLTVGVAVWRPGDVLDVQAIIRGADLAMQQAKRTGRGVAFYDDHLREEFISRTTMRRELENGIAAGDFVVHFQPLTNSRTLEVVGLEALTRWRHNGRLVPPAEWLPLAEETGLIVEIGRQVFAAARAGSERYELPVAVNVAARQLDEADFVRQVEQSWGPGAWRRLTIEVTESALLRDASHVRASLSTLAARGVRIALDDFGTGYNSLARLAELPVHILKIDRTFVHDADSPTGAAVLRAVLAVAQAHGLEVVAEGVERAEELTALMNMGVGVVQGNMLGRAAPTLPICGRRPGTAQPPAVNALLPRRLTPAASA